MSEKVKLSRIVVAGEVRRESHLGTSAGGRGAGRVRPLLEAAAVHLLQENQHVREDECERTAAPRRTHPLHVRIADVRLVAAQALWLRLGHGQQEDGVSGHCGGQGSGVSRADGEGRPTGSEHGNTYR